MGSAAMNRLALNLKLQPVGTFVGLALSAGRGPKE